MTLEYSANLRDAGRFGELCRKLAQFMTALRVEGAAVFPPGGVRVRAIACEDVIHRKGAEDARHEERNGTTDFGVLSRTEARRHRVRVSQFLPADFLVSMWGLSRQSQDCLQSGSYFSTTGAAEACGDKPFLNAQAA